MKVVCYVFILLLSVLHCLKQRQSGLYSQHAMNTSPLQSLYQINNFHETWYKYDATGANPTVPRFSFPAVYNNMELHKLVMRNDLYDVKVLAYPSFNQHCSFKLCQQHISDYLLRTFQIYGMIIM
jgi:hypothetical protein